MEHWKIIFFKHVRLIVQHQTIVLVTETSSKTESTLCFMQCSTLKQLIYISFRPSLLFSEKVYSYSSPVPGGGSHIWNGYGCKARAPTGWGIRWEHRLKKWGVIGWEHDFWHPVREKSKNMRSYWSKNEGSLGESMIFFIRWVKFGIQWEKNIKIYGVFGWEHMRL